MSMLNEFMMNADTYTAHNYLQHAMDPKDYIRL